MFIKELGVICIIGDPQEQSKVMKKTIPLVWGGVKREEKAGEEFMYICSENIIIKYYYYYILLIYLRCEYNRINKL